MAFASRTFTALGTTAQVTVTDPSVLPEAVQILEEELEAIDLVCSRFRDDSELWALNRSAGEPFAASPLLLEALSVALGAAEETAGDVDLTIGRALDALGWDSDFVVVVLRDPRPSVEAVPAHGWRSVRLDRERGLVRIPPGVELDLGATAKALAADRAARAIARATGSGVLVNLGGDLSVAGKTPVGGWSIRVTDDHRSGPAAPGQTIALHGGGLATSSTTVRRWHAGGAERHHILDPRTGVQCPETWRTVSIAAGSCVAANTASTAAIVRGPAAVPWLEEQGLPARLVACEGTITTTAGWPESS